jgi:hypothetical protein
MKYLTLLFLVSCSNIKYSKHYVIYDSVPYIEYISNVKLTGLLCVKEWQEGSTFYCLEEDR